MKVLNSAQSKELEKKAVQAGTGYPELMENAGAAAASFLRKTFGADPQRAVILCGKGNNGGDGYVVARHLSSWGFPVAVVLAEGRPVTELAQTMLRRLEGTAVQVVDYREEPERTDSLLHQAEWIVDAIYGTGFHGSVREPLLPLFRAVSESRKVLVSLDMPSGANCDTGAVEGECLKADYTVTFSTLKNGHLLMPARAFCGRVEVLPIGIGQELINLQESTVRVTEQADLESMLKPRDPESNKGNYGRLLCVCGSEGLAGAAAMSAEAAVRCGAGIVEEAVPRSIYGIVASRLPEPVFSLLDPTPDGGLAEKSRNTLVESLGKASACLIGCGLGKGKAASDALAAVLEEARVPLIIDADGINLLAENINRLKTVKAPVVLTPHPGEMARLLGTTADKVQAHRLESAMKFAEEYRVVLVLKGAGTLTAGPEGTVWLNTTGNAGMAKGGSGDVLAGMISSFIAQGIPPETAAAGAVYLHGKAGDRCAERFSQCAMLPTDLIHMLPRLFLEIGR